MNSYTQDTKPRRLTPDHTVATGLPKRHSQFALFAALATLLMTLTISGCVGLTSAGKPGKTSSNGAASPALAVSATSFSFGNVTTGSKRSQTLTLTNTGTAAVTISRARISGASFSTTGGMTSVSMVSIAAGKKHKFEIEFAPKEAGNHSGSLEMESDASDSTLSVSLNGTGMTGLSITTQPASQNVTANRTATFDVAAAGSGSINYQWKRNGIAIGGATSSIYTTPPATISDNGGSFAVVVSDGTGNVTSNPAILTVTTAPVAPAITTQPVSQIVAAGRPATFSVTATGTETLSYQWKKSGNAIGGANSASYTTPATLASDNGAPFSVTVTNSIGFATSNTATVTVTVPPTITTQPVSQAVTAGQAATFTVAAAGSGPLSYQWNRNGSAIGGAVSPSYTTSALTAADSSALFNVTVTDGVTSVTSNVATLTVNGPPTITMQPASQNVTTGQSATFTVGATGALSYQWKKNGNAIGGATSVSYTTAPATASDNGAQFMVTVANVAGTATSNVATLTMNAAASTLNASTTSLSFASLNVGSTSSLPVMFTNSGISNVTVSNVSIAGPGFNAGGIATGQIVTPGQSAALDVTFTPSAAGTGTGSATVTSNATNSPTLVTLSGTGVQPVSHSATLTWGPSTSNVAGYNIYRSAVSGGPYTKVNSTLVTTTQYMDSTVQAGQTYFDVVTSVDSNSAESTFSNEVTATIPTP